MGESPKVKNTYDKFLKDYRNLKKRYPIKILQTSTRQTKNYLQTVGKLVGDVAAIHHVRKKLASRIKPTFEYLQEHDNNIQQALNTFMSKRLELTELLASLTKALNAATAKLADQLNAALEFSLFGRRTRPDRRKQLMSLARRNRYKSWALARRQQTKRIPRLSRAAFCRQLVFGAFLIDNEIEVWLKEVLEKAKKAGKPGYKLDEKSEELLDEISRAREKVRDIYDTADKTGEGIQVFLLSVCHQVFCPEPAWDFLFTGPARKTEIKQFAGMRDMLVAGIKDLHPHLAKAIDWLKLAIPLPEVKRKDKEKTPRNAFLREGTSWRATYNGISRIFPNLKGIYYIAIMLREPGTIISVHELENAYEGVGKKRKERANTGEMVDKEGRKKFRQRIKDIEEELEEARRNNDIGLVDRKMEEKRKLIERLRKSYGLRKRPRKTGDPTEKARKAVKSCIDYAIEVIEKAHKFLAIHLTNSISTGKFCSYRPEEPVDWDL